RPSQATFTVNRGDTLYADATTVSFVAGAELVLNGVLHVRAASGQAHFVGAGPGATYWKGVRVSPTGKVLIDNNAGLDVQNATAAVTWQQMASPDVSWFSQHVMYSSNTAQFAFDRDVVVGPYETATVPPGWTLAFGPG